MKSDSVGERVYEAVRTSMPHQGNNKSVDNYSESMP